VRARARGRSFGRVEDMDLLRVVASGRRSWWALLIGSAAGALLVVLGSSTSAYRASTKLLVGPLGGSYELLRSAGEQAQTYADMAVSERVLRDAGARLPVPRTAAELEGDVVARADADSRVLTISAQTSGRVSAAATATAVAAALIRAGGARELHLVQPTFAGAGRVGGPDRPLVALAALAGLLGALALVVTRDRLRVA
jgi:capsular polysaccharide biosynthesis protein